MAPSMPTSQHSFSIAMDLDPSPDLEVFFVSSNGVELRNPWDCIEDVFGDLGESLKEASLSVEGAAEQFKNAQLEVFKSAQLNMTFNAPAGGSYTISTPGASFGIADVKPY